MGRRFTYSQSIIRFMPVISRHLTLVFTLCFFAAAVHAESLWQEKSAQAKPDHVKSKRVVAKNARYLQINSSLLNATFSTLNSTSEMTLPLPDGSNISIELSPSPILSADLAAQYPELMTYQAQQVNQPKNIGRFSISHLGLFGFFRYKNQWMLLSPRYQDEAEEYASYWYKDAPSESKSKILTKDFLLAETQQAEPRLAEKSVTTGDSVKTYKLAISTTSGYSEKNGGSTENVLAELMNLVNRINQILLVDLAIQFELIDNQALIFLDADSDPFTDSDASTDIETNQQIIDQTIGNENYDIGHVLGTDGGGLAFVGVLCNSSLKAQGYTGLSNPQGERFYIDLVAHEFGHQLGAEHSFNATDSESCDEGQRNIGTAYEPGSGSTIMSYAGICGTQNLQIDSDPYFHAISIEKIRDLVDRFSLRNCGVESNLDNSIPQIQLTQSTYTIPANTPFVLDAKGTDADDDGLTYTWEQFDNGGTSGGTSSLNELNTDNGSNPLFRSFNPTDTTQRYFPKLSDVLAGQTSIGETYATTDRDMRFRLTVRDNKGGVNQQDLVVTVTTDNQTFSIDTPTAWQSLTQQTVTWDSGDTTNSPINCSNVDILLVPDLNNPVETAVLLQTPNDGQQSVIVPNVSSENARLILRCSNNVFYALSADSFTITAAQPVVPSIDSQNVINFNEDTARTIDFADLNVSDADSSYPDEFTLTIQGGNNFSIKQNTVTPDPDFNGELTVPVEVNDGQLDSNTFLLQVQVTAINDAPVAVNNSISIQQSSNTTTINVLNNVSDVDMDVLTLMDSLNYSGQGQVAVVNQQITYTPIAGFSGSETIGYAVTDGTLTVQASLEILVTTQPVVPSIDSQNAISLNEDTQRTIIFSDLNVSDAYSSYPNDFTLTIQGGSNFSINQNTVTPDPDFNGELNVPVVVNDGQLDSNTFTLQVQVSAINDAPVAINDSITVQQNSNTTTINVLNNDSDVDMDALSIDSFTYSGQGQVTLVNKQITYTPASGFTGTESIDYVLTDGTLTDQARLSIQVNAINVNPTDSGGGGSIWLLSFLSLLCLLLQRYQATSNNRSE